MDPAARAPGRSTRVHLATLYCSVPFHSITRSSTMSCSSQNNVGQGHGSRESTTPWYSGRSTGCDSNEYDCTGHAHWRAVSLVSSARQSQSNSFSIFSTSQDLVRTC